MLKKIFIATTFILLSIFLSSSAFAQAGADSKSELGIFYGKVLPNGLTGTDEIFSLWGLRYSRSVNSDGTVLAEGTLATQADSTIDWLSASADVRMDVPIDTLTGIAFLGIDYATYKVIGFERDESFGVHAGGGIIALIGGNASFRADMKVQSKPGTTLQFGLGLVFGL